jgi:hypothetical protein
LERRAGEPPQCGSAGLIFYLMPCPESNLPSWTTAPIAQGSHFSPAFKAQNTNNSLWSPPVQTGLVRGAGVLTTRGCKSLHPTAANFCRSSSAVRRRDTCACHQCDEAWPWTIEKPGTGSACCRNESRDLFTESGMRNRHASVLASVSPPQV